MSKVLILGDIHGRGFWKEPCYNWNGRIVFLGDYHDPYGDWIEGEPNLNDSIKNLKELSDFVIGNDKVTCLLGNHDCSYFNGLNKCRFDYWQKDEVRDLLTKMNLKIYIRFANSANKFLFTHAGVVKEWANSIDDLNNIDITKPSILNQVPKSRGGDYEFGSCIWNSVTDFEEGTPLDGYYQIFGHTWSKAPFIQDTFAMLDCCKAFILDTYTKKIVEYESGMHSY